MNVEQFNDSWQRNSFLTENLDKKNYEAWKTYFEHLTVFVVPLLGMVSIVPKKELFSVPQFGQGPCIYKVSIRLHRSIKKWHFKILITANYEAQY